MEMKQSRKERKHLSTTPHSATTSTAATNSKVTAPNVKTDVHPSWAAKRQSDAVDSSTFKGTKIVFD
jgi:hypothetical protein